MKTKRAILRGVIAVITVFFSCGSERPSSKRIDIKWEKIWHIRKQMDFCGIIPGVTANDTLLSYSHSFAIGGGFKILKVNFRGDSLVTNVLFEGEKKVISHIAIGKNIVGFVQDDFENRTQHTTLLVAYDSTYSWTVKDTPVTGLRKIFFLKDGWLIEGNLNGTGQIFKSIDKGKSWRRIDLLAKNYKSFYLLNPLPGSNRIFCMGSTSYNERDNQLLLFNAEDGEVEGITQVGSFLDYVHPISKATHLHAIVDGDKLNLYSYLDSKLRLDKIMKVPQSDCIVKNLYVDESLVIVTTEPLEKGKKAVSWISYDLGNKWKPYYQKRELRLIYNPMGELFMADSENNILRGSLAMQDNELHRENGN